MTTKHPRGPLDKLWVPMTALGFYGAGQATGFGRLLLLVISVTMAWPAARAWNHRR